MSKTKVFTLHLLDGYFVEGSALTCKTMQGVVEIEAYQRLLDANKKLMAALELICDSTHGKDCDLIADKVAKLALSEASKIEGGS